MSIITAVSIEMLILHTASDLYCWPKNDDTLPSAEEICKRVLASHAICEKKGPPTLAADCTVCP
jgi:hypothetical protein